MREVSMAEVDEASMVEVGVASRVEVEQVEE